MAFKDTLGRVAGKISETATDAAEFGKAKGSLVLEKNKLNEAYRIYGEYMYKVNVLGEASSREKQAELEKLINAHLNEIETLEKETENAKKEFKKDFG